MGTFKSIIDPMPKVVAGSRWAVLSCALVLHGYESEWTPRLTALASPAPAGSAQPQLSVSDRGVLLSWIERDGEAARLKFAERTASGWSEPRVVASGRDWFVNWADVPSVVRLADGSLYGHWLQKSGASTYAYDVRLARSTDDGRTWSASVTPHHDGTQTEHGFASLFQMPGAGLGLVWLDGRAMKAGNHEGSSTGLGASHEGGGGEMSLRSATFDPGGKQTAEAVVDVRVCECCPTAAAVTAEGPIVAYRDRSAGEIRDIYVSRLVNGQWTQGAAVHADNWTIAACPVNGPALSANGRTVVIAWFTATGDHGHAYAAFSSDAGRTFGSPIRLDESSALGRVDVMLLPDGSAAATWIEFAENRAEFRLRRVTTRGERSAALPVAAMASSRASGYPRMAAFGRELVFAWTEAGTPSHVKTAVAMLP
jgi:hypothetical protein